MWMYSGLKDSTRIHPEEVDDDTLEKWLSGITRNKDNPKGARRVNRFSANNQPDKVWALLPTVLQYIMRLSLNLTDIC